MLVQLMVLVLPHVEQDREKLSHDRTCDDDGLERELHFNVC